MTVKGFFKGKAFKCIAVLLCVLLVSGVLLSVAYVGGLKVTDEERFARKINAVYGGETVTATETDISDKNTSVNNATIQNVWYITEKKDYLVQASSRGYGGDITCWIAITLNDDLQSVKGVRKVIKYAVADAAELIGNIGDEIYEKFATDYEDGKTFGYGTEGNDDFISTGASYTMSAICNCVNGSIEFIKAHISEAEISNPLEGLQHTDVIDGTQTTWSAQSGVITYNIVTLGTGKPNAFTFTIKVTKEGDTAKITEYTIVTNGSTAGFEASMAQQAKNLNGKTLAEVSTLLNGTEAGSLTTGATYSNQHCYKAAAFALANYDACLNSPKGGN